MRGGQINRIYINIYYLLPNHKYVLEEIKETKDTRWDIRNIFVQKSQEAMV